MKNICYLLIISLLFATADAQIIRPPAPSRTEVRGIQGALLGAAVGGVIGNQSGRSGKGALIGAVGGALLGTIIGQRADMRTGYAQAPVGYVETVPSYSVPAQTSDGYYYPNAGYDSPTYVERAPCGDQQLLGQLEYVRNQVGDALSQRERLIRALQNTDSQIVRLRSQEENLRRQLSLMQSRGYRE